MTPLNTAISPIAAEILGKIEVQLYSIKLPLVEYREGERNAQETVSIVVNDCQY